MTSFFIVECTPVMSVFLQPLERTTILDYQLGKRIVSNTKKALIFFGKPQKPSPL